MRVTLNAWRQRFTADRGQRTTDGHSGQAMIADTFGIDLRLQLGEPLLENIIDLHENPCKKTTTWQTIPVVPKVGVETSAPDPAKAPTIVPELPDCPAVGR